MKKIILSLVLLLVLSCSKDEVPRVQECTTCTEETQFYYTQNGVTTTGDHFSYNVEEPNCDDNGTVTVTHTPFNGGIITEETTIVCQ